MNPYAITTSPRRMQVQAPATIDNSNLFKEISSSQSLIEKALYPYDQNWDPIVRRKGLELYRDMTQDDQVKACLDLRKQARLSTPWTIASAEDGNQTADMYADFIKHILERMRGTFEDDLYQIYSAVEYGFSVSEINYYFLPDGEFKGKIGIQSIKTREPFNYDFKTDVHGNLLGIVYNGALPKEITEVNGGMGTADNPFPPDKFVIYSYNMKFSNWYGTSDLYAAFRSWQSKKIIMRFWNIWLERYASPFVWATVDPNVSLKKQAIDELDDFLKNLSARAGFRCPQGVVLNPVQFSATSSQAYEQAIESHNRFISHALLCPNLLGYTQQQSTGSYALGKKHFDAFLWILQKMGRDTSESIVGEQIIERLIKLNFPNPDPSLFPKFKFEGIEEDSIESRARILTMLSNAGFVSREEDWIREFLTLPKKEEDVKLPDMRAGMPTQGRGFPKDDEDEDTDSDSDPKKTKEEFESKDFQTRRERAEFFEKKIKAKSFAREMDSADEMMTGDLVKSLMEVQEDVLDFVLRKRIVETGDVREVNKVPVNVGKLKEFIRAWLSKIYLDSKLRAFEELGRAGVEVEIVRKFENAVAPFEPWNPLQPKEAVEFFNRKVKAYIVNVDGEKKLVELATRSELAYYDERAFAIAGVVRDDILNSAKQIILNGIKRQDAPGTATDLKDMFQKYVRSGVAVDDELLEPHRLNTIVRTNVTEAVNEGRRSMYEDPDVKGFVGFWEYSSILDDRTTEYCRCMDGKVFRIEDLPLLNPPAHYNCRSLVVPVTKFEVEELNSSGSGVEISRPCPDRASSFADIKRDPVSIPFPMPGVPPKPLNGDGSSLQDDLSKIITTCPYSTCRSSRVRMVGSRMNVSEFACDSCKLPFRISSHGDLYLYDAGEEKWERVSVGNFPSYYKHIFKR